MNLDHLNYERQNQLTLCKLKGVVALLHPCSLHGRVSIWMRPWPLLTSAQLGYTLQQSSLSNSFCNWSLIGPHVIPKQLLSLTECYTLIDEACYPLSTECL